MSATPNLRLPYLDANQNQKSVTHNAALRMLDALVGLGVRSSALQAPPAAPADGGRWIVASGGSGAWAGKDLDVAAWQDGAWSFYAPVPGLVAFDAGQNTLVVWTGAAWTPLPALLQMLGVAALGVGTAPDRANPLSATLNNALFNALPSAAGGTGDVRLKLNKAGPGSTASFLFQDGFSGRAEIGLAGDDDFHFKVSADGASFFDAIVVAGAGGAVSFLLSPTAPTATTGDSSQKLATTAFVAAAVGSGTGSKGATGAAGPQGAAGATGATGAMGAAGPQGTAGATGATGGAGLQGTAGAAGATGAAGPQGTAGIAGATGAAGPQGAAGIAGATGAAGPQGTAGTAGATGAVGPQGTAGIAGATGAAGPQGTAGATGAVGSQGAAGATGATGAAGPQGAAGATGATGATGTAGTSVTIKGSVSTSASLPNSGNVLGDGYIASDTGHLWVYSNSTATGSVNGFVDVGLVRGPVGPQGPQGAAGATGATGISGPQGTAGATGATGAAGSQGTAGATGATGAAGPQGMAGATGATGAAGLQGTAGATGATGTSGPQGTAGAAGTSGPQGTAGATGATGTSGPQGAAGATGATGTLGPQGMAGTAGATGAAGAQGTAGTAGATGAAGPQGATGTQGATGSTGAASTVPGPAGSAGATGATGPAGATGAAGFSRTQVADAAYTALTADRTVAYIALTASRTVILPAASAYPAGGVLTLVDESGACSPTVTLTLAAAGSDRINGAASAVIATPYGYLQVESNTSNKWTVVDAPAPVASVAGRTGAVALAVADVAGAAPLASPALTGTPTAPNAAAGTNSSQVATTSFVAASFVTYAYAGANYATANNATLTGTPTAPTAAIADNSTRLATTAYADRAAAQGTLARTQVADAAYTVLPSDRVVAVTALTASRTLTLPAASAYPQGATLTVVDESGACSATSYLVLACSGSDKVNGGANSVLTSPYAYAALESNGSNKWTIIDLSTLSMAQQASNAVSITGGSVVGVNGVFVSNGTAGGFGGAWNNSDITTGAAPGAGSGSGRAAMRFDAANNVAYYGAIAPGYSWYPGVFQFLTMQFVSAGTGVSGLFQDSSGNVGVKTTAPGTALDVNGPARFGTYTVSTLPAGIAGAMAFVSNGRKIGEAAGSGTGVLVVYSNSSWRRLSDDSAVAS